MLLLLVAYVSSFVVTLLIVRFKSLHGQFTGDNVLLGPQKFHVESVPRIGGVGVAFGILAAVLVTIDTSEISSLKVILLLCSIPIFAIGLTEDITKKIGVRTRLLFASIAALLAVYYLGISITKLDIPGIDYLLSIPIVAILFTVFAITGLANAYNIIDGFNGLSSMVGIITLAGLAYVSYVFQDAAILSLSLILVGAILGFFFWNYPKGLIFLGDGGAYLIGFWVAVLSVLLVARNPEISPWFALLINAYPVLETLFTIYRRRIHQGRSPGSADGIHFHTLIYRRILRSKAIKTKYDFLNTNARTAPYLWLLSAMAVIPALLFLESTQTLIFFTLIFTISYSWLYTRIVRFKIPRWMHLGGL